MSRKIPDRDRLGAQKKSVLLNKKYGIMAYETQRWRIDASQKHVVNVLPAEAAEEAFDRLQNRL